MNKLENFILFHLFKLPALLTVVGLACFFIGGQVHQTAAKNEKLVQLRAKINLEQVNNLGHLVQTNGSLAQLYSQNDIKVIAENPTQLIGNADAIIKLEQRGLVIQQAAYADGKMQVTVKPYPPKKQ